jgi:hypothetical protein
MFDALQRIRADLAAVAEESRAGWPAAAQTERVRELAEIRERIDAEIIRTVGQWDAEGCWADDGALSAASWLAEHTPMNRATANRIVRSARLVREHEATAEALASGAVSSVHVDTIATVTRNREDLYPEGEDALLTAAEVLGADDFTVVARHWRSLADDAAGNQDAFGVHERRFFHLSKTLFGTLRIDGELDLDGGETLLAALDAPGDDAAADGRTAGQRNADNLVQLAASFLAGGGSDARPQVATNVVIDFDTLLGRERQDLHELRRELAHLGPIAQETALRLACDASVIRVVMSGKSEVLDLARSTRVVSPAQRRALVLRDGGCGFPGCDRRPDWCDAHHVWHWVKGGPTDLWNLVLLCRRHHVLCHEGGWYLARGPDGVVRAFRPDGTELVLAA